jgi:excinuclease UvrABC nuclease subunit
VPEVQMPVVKIKQYYMIGIEIKYRIDNFSGILDVNENNLPTNPPIGVYFLYDVNKEIIYIGKSVVSIRSRLRNHLFVERPDTYNDYNNELILSKRKDIKYFSYIVVPKEYVDMVERYLIFKHKGKFNIEFNYK